MPVLTALSSWRWMPARVKKQVNGCATRTRFLCRTIVIVKYFFRAAANGSQFA
jgi:hypothetical protein